MTMAATAGYRPASGPWRINPPRVGTSGASASGSTKSGFGKSGGVDGKAKVVVKGPGIDPLFDYLTNAATNPKFAGDIKWNFNKFLVGRDGTVLARFEPKVEPGSPEVTSAIEKDLG